MATISILLVILFSVILALRVLHLFFNLDKCFLTRMSTLHGVSLLLTILLFYAGLQYVNITLQTTLELLFKSLGFAIENLTLKFNNAEVQTAFDEVEIYRFAFYLSFVSCIIVSTTLVLKLFFKRVITKVRLLFSKTRRHAIVIGNNVEAHIFINNLEKQVIFWNHVQSLDYGISKNSVILFEEPLTYKSFSKLVKNASGEFISFLDSDESIVLLNYIEEFLKENTECKIKFYLKYNHMNDRFFDSVMNNFSNKVFMFNPYEMSARKLIFEHPASAYMSSKQIDYGTALIKPDTDINFFILGYGKVNQKFVALSIFNQLFATKKDGEIVDKVVNYYVYDKTEEPVNKDISDFLHYNELLLDKNDYFELPKKNSLISYQKADLYSSEFCDNLCKTFKTNSYNQIMISFDDDNDNIDIALKVLEVIKRNKIDFDYQVFVRIKQDIYRKSSHVADLLKNNHLIAYGTEGEILSPENIIQENLDLVAQTRNAYYYKTNGVKGKSPLELWQTLNYNKQLSNRYSSSSLPFKLHLMGLQLTNELDKGISKSDFLLKYDPKNTISRNDHEDIIYTLNSINMFINPRQVLAFIEHERWNSFYLFRGYLPMKKIEIKLLKAAKGYRLYKDDDQKRVHACLTTMAGLNKYRELQIDLYKANGQIVNEMELDVIKYDLQLMDNIFEEIKDSKLVIAPFNIKK